MWIWWFFISRYTAPIAMKFLWDTKDVLVMLQLNFHEIWMSYSPVINVSLYMLYNAYLFVYFDISKITCHIEMKFLW
jgi:hypothetical protein